MRRIFHFAICFLLLSAAVVPAFAGEIIDGIVATVNRQPLLRSDWDEAVCFEAFMQQKPLTAVTESDRVLALQRLIDRQLLQRRWAMRIICSRRMTSCGRTSPSCGRKFPTATTMIAGSKLLASYGLSEGVVAQHLRTEFQVMNFVEVRLRPNVHVQGDEVESLLPEPVAARFAKERRQGCPSG